MVILARVGFCVCDGHHRGFGDEFRSNVDEFTDDTPEAFVSNFHDTLCEGRTHVVAPRGYDGLRFMVLPDGAQPRHHADHSWSFDSAGDFSARIGMG
jgi:hypothetical protein